MNQLPNIKTKTAIFGISDVGGADILKRVAENMRRQNFKCLFYFNKNGAAFDRLSSDKLILSSASTSPSKLFKKFKPDIAIATPNTPDKLIPINFINVAHEQKVPTVLVQDFWGNHARPGWKALPDLICVQDTLGKKLVLKSWPSIKPKQVVITGQPAFDELSLTNVKAAEKKLRQDFKLNQNWPIIHFSGGYAGMPEAVSRTIAALNKLNKPIYLFIRHHPKLTSKNASNQSQKIYKSYADLHKNLRVGKYIASDTSTPSDLINAAADIVISMYSTLSIKACYLRKDCLSIWVPEGRNEFKHLTGGLLDQFPPVTLEACLSATTISEITECLDKIYKGKTKSMHVAQEKHFVADGQSTERVFQAISKII